MKLTSDQIDDGINGSRWIKSKRNKSDIPWKCLVLKAELILKTTWIIKEHHQEKEFPIYPIRRWIVIWRKLRITVKSKKI